MDIGLIAYPAAQPGMLSDTELFHDTLNDINQARNGGDKNTWFKSPFEVNTP